MAYKKYEDYSQELYKLFPFIEESSIDYIVEYGFKKLHHYIRIGNDVFLKYSLFIGKYSQESSEQWIKSTYKEHTKRQLLFKESKIPWNGIRYIGLTEEENLEFITNGVLSTVTLYKLLKECIIRTGIKYIYQVELNHMIPEKEVFWMEKKENFFLKDCVISEEGSKLLALRERKRELKLKTNI